MPVGEWVLRRSPAARCAPGATRASRWSRSSVNLSRRQFAPSMLDRLVQDQAWPRHRDRAHRAGNHREPPDGEPMRHGACCRRATPDPHLGGWTSHGYSSPFLPHPVPAPALQDRPIVRARRQHRRQRRLDGAPSSPWRKLHFITIAEGVENDSQCPTCASSAATRAGFLSPGPERGPGRREAARLCRFHTNYDNAAYITSASVAEDTGHFME